MKRKIEEVRDKIFFSLDILPLDIIKRIIKFIFYDDFVNPYYYKIYYPSIYALSISSKKYNELSKPENIIQIFGLNVKFTIEKTKFEKYMLLGRYILLFVFATDKQIELYKYIEKNESLNDNFFQDVSIPYKTNTYGFVYHNNYIVVDFLINEKEITEEEFNSKLNPKDEDELYCFSDIPDHVYKQGLFYAISVPVSKKCHEKMRRTEWPLYGRYDYTKPIWNIIVQLRYVAIYFSCKTNPLTKEAFEMWKSNKNHRIFN